MSHSPTPSATAVLADTTGAHVLHSHHYHGPLLRALHEADGIDAGALLLSAVEACGSGIVGPAPIDAGWSWLEDRVHAAGLGHPVRGDMSGGIGTLRLEDSHFAAAWRARYAPARRPVCGVAAAVIAKLLSETAGAVRRVSETACVAAGARACVFEACAAPGGALPDEAGYSFTGADATPPRPAFPGRALEASADGAIRGTGGPFAALPAEFYAAVAHLFEVEVPLRRGAKFASLPGILLMEAAHWNGFRLFGETLASDGSRDDEGEPAGMDDDVRLRTLLQIPAALGWGRWELASFVPGERLIVRIHDSYEAIGHERLFGRSPGPRCTVARGAAAAVMNLLYRSADGTTRAALDGSRYNALFRSPRTFRAVETRCRAQGDACCELVTNPLTV